MPSFSNAWDASKPAGSRDLSLGDDDIREFKVQVQERVNVDHYFTSTDDATQTGYHRMSTYIEQAGDPSAVANTIILYGHIANSVTELFSRHETAGINQLTVNGKINAANFAISSEAQGDLITRGVTNWERLALGSARQILAVNSAGNGVEWSDNKRTVLWFVSSSAAVGTRTSARIYMATAGTFTKWWIDAKTAPVGSDLVIDVNKNGSTIWATQANRAKVVAGANVGSGTTFDTTTFAAGDYLDIDVDQIGSSTAGADVTIMLEIK